MIFKWKSFLIDIPSFMAWLASTYPSLSFGNFSDAGMFSVGVQGPGLTPTIKTAIQAHWDGLDQSEETTKRALPSRKVGAAKVDFEKLVKSFIATKEWADMSVIERKFAMNTPLTNAEYDTLTTS